MMKAMLIDDEPESLQFISSLIGMFCPTVSIMGMYTDPFEGMAAIDQRKPDVLLLDIEMPGMTGFELLRRLAVVDFELIFVTAHNQYALNAIKLSALDYLLKPVDPTELENALQKAEERLKEKRTVQRLDVLVGLLSKTNETQPVQQHKIALPTSDGLIYVEMSGIIRIEAVGNYCKFYPQNSNFLMISKHMGLYEGSLDTYEFMRVGRSDIINLRHVVEYVRHEGGYVKMTDGSRVPVSSAKREELLNRLSRL